MINTIYSNIGFYTYSNSATLRRLECDTDTPITLHVKNTQLKYAYVTQRVSRIFFSSKILVGYPSRIYRYGTRALEAVFD